MPTTATIQNVIPADVIDLGIGDPPPSLLPLDVLRAAAEKRLINGDNSLLQYGAEQGDGYFRLTLAQFLSKNYRLDVSAENLFVTNGISNALDLICTLFTQAGDTIFVEEPTYFLALRIFADHKLNVVSIDTDVEGLNIEQLHEKLKVGSPKFLYVIPTFQNPSGHTLSQEKRDQLVLLSDQYKFTIVADEVYHLLSYTQDPPKSFAAYIDHTNIMTLGSFSKILAPGLRLGWLHAHLNTIRKFTGSGLLDSSGGLNPFTSAILQELIAVGDLEKNIGRLREVYAKRLQITHLALQKYIPEVTYTIPHGGYFYWLKIHNGLSAPALRERAKIYKVDIRQGSKFSSKNGLDQFFRIGFVYYESDQIEEGIRRLADCIKGK